MQVSVTVPKEYRYFEFFVFLSVYYCPISEETSLVQVSKKMDGNVYILFVCLDEPLRNCHKIITTPQVLEDMYPTE